MSSDHMEDWKFKMAKKRVKRVKGFYQHFGAWLATGAFFVILWMFTGGGDFWPIFPIAGWGLGLAMHAIGVFGFPGKTGDWEERMMEQEMSRVEEEYYRRQQKSAGALPPHSQEQDGLELKEVRKEWRDSDLV